VNSSAHPTDPLDVRAAYQVVGQLIVYEGRLVWNHATVFALILGVLLVGAFLPTFPGVSSKELTALLQSTSALLAVASAMVWWSMAVRSRAYYAYWIAQGRALESQMPGISILTEGRRLGRGNEVSIAGDVVKLPLLARFSHSIQVHYLYALVSAISAVVALNRLWNLARVL
jgi:hypothetical protein